MTSSTSAFDEPNMSHPLLLRTAISSATYEYRTSLLALLTIDHITTKLTRPCSHAEDDCSPLVPGTPGTAACAVSITLEQPGCQRFDLNRFYFYLMRSGNRASILQWKPTGTVTNLPKWRLVWPLFGTTASTPAKAFPNGALCIVKAHLSTKVAVVKRKGNKEAV